jgi:hypothetical protein
MKSFVYTLNGHNYIVDVSKNSLRIYFLIGEEEYEVSDEIMKLITHQKRFKTMMKEL